MVTQVMTVLPPTQITPTTDTFTPLPTQSDPTQVAGPSTDLFAERLSAYDKAGSVGPEIKDSLGKFINHFISNFMDDKMCKELGDKYLKLANTSNLVAPRA